MKVKRAIVWFRNDLRLHDQVTLKQAMEQAEEVIPVYIFDPERWRHMEPGFVKTGAFQTQFLLEAVADLKNNLKSVGSGLMIYQGVPATRLLAVAESFGADKVFASKEVTWEETQQETAVAQALEEAGKSLELVWQATLFHEEDIPWPIQKLPEVFTQFRKENEKSTPIRPALPAPKKIPTPELPDTNLPDLESFGLAPVLSDPRAVMSFAGGETAAWKRLHHYFWDTDELKNYKWTRNGLLGADYSSKFSPWLAHGCVSPRAIYEEVKRYETERTKNVSTYWLVFELIWRDYFRFVCKRYGRSVFFRKGIKGKPLELTQNLELFEKWRTGMTGVPFVDANMRELLLTGFMSNRGRQNVASYLVKDLNIDWRWGARWFESQLLDYDVCSNWANWMYVAGVGNDPRENRYFNIPSQARKYDAKGEYVRTWVPELAAIPGGNIHLDELSERDIKSHGVAIGTDYPYPINR
ncbi:DASH family cryptochrome [Marinoscillum furvescens]|uniref:Cryptochrome DASH n=1 Tax=Marinoscillum furvescens DSM 4134 TaxID=1122208 RepID=A0A3D9KYA2_MARFU|nr:DASH family cryptochrome [Marinoscillum furvescens]RED94098.1 deoxyribodipyrimidine photo-lyase (single-stranded DNA-specific) [Marinoscillum furvescens DSM 4134]